MQHQDYDRRLGYYTLLRLAENTFVQLCPITSRSKLFPHSEQRFLILNRGVHRPTSPLSFRLQGLPHMVCPTKAHDQKLRASCSGYEYNPTGLRSADNLTLKDVAIYLASCCPRADSVGSLLACTDNIHVRKHVEWRCVPAKCSITKSYQKQTAND